jgi:hypothetical protein
MIPPSVIPTPSAVPRGADNHARREHQRARQNGVENSGGIVAGHVDALRVRWSDVNNSGTRILPNRHDLLGRRFEIANLLGLRTQHLHDRHHVIGLHRESHPERMAPVHMLGEELDFIRETHERLNRRIPLHRVDLRKIAPLDRKRVRSYPAIRFLDLNRMGACR